MDITRRGPGLIARSGGVAVRSGGPVLPVAGRDGVRGPRIGTRLGGERRGGRVPAKQVYDDSRPSGASSAPDGQGEVVPPPHPVSGRQHCVRGRSDRDAGAALAAPRRQDGAPSAGAHAKPEAVLLVATAVVRLESTLAHLRLQCCCGRRVQSRGFAPRAASGPPQRGPTRLSVKGRDGGHASSPSMRLDLSTLRATRPSGQTERPRHLAIFDSRALLVQYLGTTPRARLRTPRAPRGTAPSTRPETFPTGARAPARWAVSRTPDCARAPARKLWVTVDLVGTNTVRTGFLRRVATIRSQALQ